MRFVQGANLMNKEEQNVWIAAVIVSWGIAFFLIAMALL
jgi:uncharacterized protein (DUF486 family)